MRKISTLSLSLFLLFSIVVTAQIPAGYYDSAIGKKQAELKTALHLIIKTANVPSYGSGAGSTWAAFAKMDVRPEDGTVWDMYSNNHVAFNGNSAASGMNIEHSFAKSWWGDGRQAAQDVQHLCPSNSTANSAKGSWPMAVVDGKTTFDNSCIKVGKSSSKPGMTLDAWEPADEYKGDFARMYMYMVTAYEDYATLWTGNSINQLDNNTYPVFEQWTVDLLLKWSRQDPVSQKEITRTNEAYKIQGNRNPFIDYPLLAEYIWGNLMTVPFTTDGNVTYPYLSTPSSGSVVDFGKVVYQHNSTSTLQLKAVNLTGDLTLAVSGTDAAEFSVPATITKADAEAGYTLTIQYSAKTTGAKTAQLTISGGGISNTVVSLKATCSDEFLALPATNITHSGFTANWTQSAYAEGYTLDVFSLQSNGATQPKTVLTEEFASGLPSTWTKEGYADNTSLTGSMRLASGSSMGKLTTPAMDLSSSGNSITVRAKQYSNDTGAQLTALLDGQPLTVWSTAVDFKDYTFDFPAATATSTISLSAASGSRVYVDNVVVKTQGAVQSAVSVSGFPKLTGNVLSYEVSGLQSDSTYYYTITPVGNNVAVSDKISVHTTQPNAIVDLQDIRIDYRVIAGGVLLSGLPAGSSVSLLDLTGKRLKTLESKESDVLLPLQNRGIYLLQVQQAEGLKIVKILY